MTDPAKADDTLKKLLDALENKKMTIFDEEEVSILRELIKVWSGLKALGWLTDSLVRALKIAAVLAALGLALKHGSLDALRGLAGVK